MRNRRKLVATTSRESGLCHQLSFRIPTYVPRFGKAIESKKKQSLSKPKYTQYPDEGHWAKFIFRYRPKGKVT